MTNGNKLRRQLAGQLYEGSASSSSDRSPIFRSSSTPIPHSPSNVREAPDCYMLDNPLYLASNLGTFDLSPGEPAPDTPPRDASNDTSLYKEDPFNSTSPPTPLTNQQPSYEPFPEPFEHSYYGSAHSSPNKRDNLNEIEEDPNMMNRRRHIIDVPLNVLGSPTPPPGYHVEEAPPLKRFFREAHRIWIAPALAGLPTFLDNWWKTRKPIRKNEEAKWVGSALQGLADGTLNLTPGEVLTTRIAGSVFIFLSVSFLLYAWFEQRKRNEEVIIDTGRHNLDRDMVVSFVPKKKYLVDVALAASKNELPQEPQGGTPKPSLPERNPYQYPPTGLSRVLRR